MYEKKISGLADHVRRLPHLDSARGFAALSVITWHCFTAVVGHIQDSPVYSTPFHFFWYGEADVIFFFIHSGFILSYSYFAVEKQLSGPLYLKYLIKRIFRIYPLFLFVLIISYLLRTLIFPVSGSGYVTEHFAAFWKNPVGLKDLVNQGLLVIRIPDEANHRLIPQDWTLTVELLICPWIPLLAFLSKKLIWIFWPAVLVLIKVFHFNTYLFEFATGIFIFTVMGYPESLWNKMRMPLKMGILLLAVALYTCFFRFGSIFNLGKIVFTPAADRISVVAGCALFFLIILSSSRLKKLLSFKPFVLIGKVCYSLYVIHLLLLICFSNLLFSCLYHGLGAQKWLIMPLFIITIQVCTFLLSLATYHCIEKPLNTMGKAVGEKVKNLFERSRPFRLR